MKPLVRIFFIFVLSSISIISSTAQDKVHARVDDEGILRWQNGEEVQGFGVNYTVPFAHAFRSAKKLGVDPKEAIKNDVYHFARLGFDLYRIHVWDTEICDTLGNLIDNEQLDHFDFLLNELTNRGINYVITPIAFWGNGWPEPDEVTPGFSAKYGKDACLTNADAIKAQENYLFQFLNHVNPYKGVAYKDDPQLIAFEVSNEPHHREEPELVTSFIQKMVNSMRKTGCEKPIFYNVSHSVHLAQNYFDAGIDGGTFQWYPTGLGAQRELGGNLMQNVNNYNIPFNDVIKENKGAKLVYEFDAADVGRSYIYPAMAMSFREAGIQIATHFAYDPTYLAYANTEYNTHYMNLAYAPQKALSLMIASKVFHTIPINEAHPKFSSDTKFRDYHLSYTEDLAEYLTDELFIYTNHTNSVPTLPKKLKSVAGYGNSLVVKYDGLGAYFLDKIEKGIWRLEVMPDAIWVDNLFGRNSLDRTLAVINWNEWTMKLNLPDLKKEFSITGINEGNKVKMSTNDGSFMIKPGVYLLSTKGKKFKQANNMVWQNIKLNEYYAPETSVTQTHVLHEPTYEIEVGQNLEIVATVISDAEIESVTLFLYGGWRPKSIPMKKVGYEYTCLIPSEDIRPGFFRYFISVDQDDGATTFPSGTSGQPGEWDFSDPNCYETRVVAEKSPVMIFDASVDAEMVDKRWLPTVRKVPSHISGGAAYQINVPQLWKKDNENLNADPIYDYSIKYYFGDKISGRKAAFDQASNIFISARAMNDKPCTLQIALVDQAGNAFGKQITVDTTYADFTIPLNELLPVSTVTLPRPYPTFLPYYFENSMNDQVDLSNMESLQISIGPGIAPEETDDKHGVLIQRVWVE